MKIEIWECADCNFQMVQDQKHVDSGGHKKYGCPICEIEKVDPKVGDKVWHDNYASAQNEPGAVQD